MYRNKFLFAIILSFIFAHAVNVFAWDGKRKGFILGAGAGAGRASYNVKVEALGFPGVSYTSPRESRTAFMSDFKIGYAPSNKVMIFWMSKVAWFGEEIVIYDETSPVPLGTKTFTVSSGVGGAGISYYFQPEGPSPYLTGGIGFSSWATPFEENSTSYYGSGLALGAGYEFSKHWSLEGNVTFGDPNDEEMGGKFTINASAFRVTVNVLGY